MSEEQPAPVDPLKQISMLREEIRFEHGLIANRLSAMLTVQPFLLAAFAVAATVEAQHRQRFIWFSYGIVPVVGLLVAVLALLAMLEGERRLRLLRKLLYEDGRLAALADRVCPQLDPRAQTISLFYAAALPAVFALAWIYVAGMGVWLLAQR
jgi:hypothetical protein